MGLCISQGVEVGYGGRLFFIFSTRPSEIRTRPPNLVIHAVMAELSRSWGWQDV